MKANTHTLHFAWFIIGLMLITACAGETSQKESVPVVKTTKVTSTADSITKSYPAKIREASEVNLSFRVAGPIEEIYVSEGEYVSKGSLLARMDPRDYRLQLQGTEAKYKEVKAEAERILALHKKGKVSDNEYDKAVSGLDQITARYEAHKNALNDTKLTAPFSGYINKIFFEPGETIDTGIPVVSVVDSQQYEIVTHISPSDYMRRDQFKSFSCKTIDEPIKEWPLELRNFVSKSNLNGLYPAYFNLKNPENNRLYPGMSAELIIHIQNEGQSHYKLPSSAIFSRNNQSKVWILKTDNNTVQSQEVKIIRINSSGQAIVEGKFQEDAVIVSGGVHSLEEGEEVKQLEEPSETNVGNLL